MKCTKKRAKFNVLAYFWSCVSLSLDYIWNIRCVTCYYNFIIIIIIIIKNARKYLSCKSLCFQLWCIGRYGCWISVSSDCVYRDILFCTTTRTRQWALHIRQCARFNISSARSGLSSTWVRLQVSVWLYCSIKKIERFLQSEWHERFLNKFCLLKINPLRSR